MPVTKSALRAVKNITRGASDAEALLRATTSNDALPPTGRQLHEIARASYDAADLPSILEILDKRLNDKGKYWRHVYKSLIVLDYLLHTGSPSVASYFRQNIYLIKTLAEFQHVDDTGRDVGKDVRVRARDVARLLQNPSLLDDARRNRRAMYDRMAGRDSSESAARKDEKPPTLPPRPKSQEDREAAELAKVLKLSEQEEAARRAALAKANEGDLFDEMANELIDLSETPSLQPQPTVMPGYLQPQYTSMQPQYTSLQPRFTSLQPQYTSLQPQYSPFQPQYTGVQQQYTGLQPQYTAAYDPYNQQAQYEALLQQQQQQQWEQPKPLEPQLTVNIGSNNPFGPRALSAPVYDPNTNPFARASTPSGSSASSLSPPRTPPSAYTDHGHARTSSADDYRGADRFNVDYRSASAPSGIDWEKRGKMSALERAIAARDDGQDTFGNVGSLRYGSTTHGRLAAQRTGAYVQ